MTEITPSRNSTMTAKGTPTGTRCPTRVLLPTEHEHTVAEITELVDENSVLLPGVTPLH